MDNFKIILDVHCILLVQRSGVFAVADEASGFSLDNMDVKFFNNFGQAYKAWTEMLLEKIQMEREAVHVKHPTLGDIFKESMLNR